MIKCNRCGFWNNDYGVCTCPSQDMWYACPIENKKPENIQSLKEHTEWLPEYQGKWVAESEKKNSLNKIRISSVIMSDKGAKK